MQAQIHAPRTGYAYNLLDNSDFRNPINQRGASTYSGDFTYSIDRWQLGNGGAQIYVISDGLKISNATGAGDYIFQRLERLPPGNYTFAAKFRDNTGVAALSNYSVDQGVTLAPTSYADSGVLVLTFSNGEDLDSAFAYCRLQNITPGAVCTWEWAALYEGSYTADTLPPWVAPDPVTELIKCKDFFRELSAYGIIGVAVVDSASTVLGVVFGEKMRIDNPSLTGDVAFYSTDATIILTSVTQFQFTGNGFRLAATSSGGLSVGTFGLLIPSPNSAAISADL